MQLFHSSQPSFVANEPSQQNSKRMRCNQRDHSVAAESKPVHAIGQPISTSTNAGFKVRGVCEVSLPSLVISRAGRECTAKFAN